MACADFPKSTKKPELPKHYIEKRHALGLYNDDENFVDQQRLEALRGEQNFPSALRLFSAASANRKYFLQASVYIALLQSCARHQNFKEAIRLFTHLERRGFPKPSASIYAHLLDVYMSVNDIEGKIVWDEANPMSARAGHIRVWNSMINAYLRAANTGAALDLLGEMLDMEAEVEFGPKDVPAPAMSTITQTIEESTEMDPWLCAIHALHVGVRPEPLPCRTEEYDWVMWAVDELLDEYLWFA
ncbi:hypothetical protein F5888DRAFT_1802383 [Russula emetica]|nr:hypothetical protein F5888DRAFT_1802383 [Russula emetica]